MNNWFKVSRHIFESDMWNEKPFDFSHAWLDMVGNANYKDGTIWIRGNEVRVKRGQLSWSIRFMKDRWGYTQKKVLYFLNRLKSDTQISIDQVYPISLISIINYEKYQGENEECDTQKGTQKGTQTDTILKKVKKVKKEKKGENTTAPTYDKTWGKEIADKYFVLEEDVERLWERMVNSRLANGKPYTNWKRGLLSWLLPSIEEGKIKKTTDSALGGFDLSIFKEDA